MARNKGKLTVIYQNGKRRMVVKTPFDGSKRIVVVLNSQFTNAPNTTQISSGAGRSSAAGNDAAIASSNTEQQQSVGAGGRAKNTGMRGKQSEPGKHRKAKNGKEDVIIINDQVVKLAKSQRGASATQVAGGGGTYSTGGTNAAIESANTKQQHAVGGGPGSRASNSGMNNRQKESAGTKAKRKAKAARKRQARPKRRRK